MTKLDWEKSPQWFVRNRREIWDAIELIEIALDEYDEDCGLAFSDIPEKFERVKDFIHKICFPEFHEEKQLEACKQLATTIESIIGSQSDVEKYIRMPKMDDIIVTKSLKYQLPKFIKPNKFGYLNDTRILVLDDKGYTIEKLNLPVSFTIEFPERLIGKKVAVVSYRIIPEKNQLS